MSKDEYIPISKNTIKSVLDEIERELKYISSTHYPDNYNKLYYENMTRRLVRIRAKVNLLYRLGLITYGQKNRIDDMF